MRDEENEIRDRKIKNIQDMARYYKIKAILSESEEEKIGNLKKEDSLNWALAWLIS